jgi:creatinine amidohydrolase/Fe(II)-dependent formamide hydrolase-like protein
MGHGDPTKATSEKGMLMWNSLVDHLVSFIHDMDEVGWEVDKEN